MPAKKLWQLPKVSGCPPSPLTNLLSKLKAPEGARTILVTLNQSCWSFLQLPRNWGLWDTRYTFLM